MRLRLIHIIVLLALAPGGSVRAAEGGGEFLEIPGFGRVPLPPGVRGFPQSPPAEPDEPSAAPGPRAKAPPPPPPVTREEALEKLFARLAAAQDKEEGDALALRALKSFAHIDSDTAALLADRAAAAQRAGAPLVAKSLLDEVTLLAPRWAEGFVRRARLRESLGDTEGALRDLRAATEIEPRRFDAFAMLGALSETAGDKKAAIDAYRRSLALAPMQEPVRQAHDRLKLEIDGRDI